MAGATVPTLEGPVSPDAVLPASGSRRPLRLPEWASALDEAIKAVTEASPGTQGDPVQRGEDRPLAEARAAHG